MGPNFAKFGLASSKSARLRPKLANFVGRCVPILARWSLIAARIRPNTVDEAGSAHFGAKSRATPGTRRSTCSAASSGASGAEFRLLVTPSPATFSAAPPLDFGATSPNPAGPPQCCRPLDIEQEGSGPPCRPARRSDPSPAPRQLTQRDHLPHLLPRSLRSRLYTICSACRCASLQECSTMTRPLSTAWRPCMALGPPLSAQM